MNYEDKLSYLKKEIDRRKELKNKAEGRLETLKIQQEALNKELEALNINPEDLDNTINELQTKIDSLFSEIADNMPEI
ncbi:hypothetical protein [Peptoniphilus indolicus]|uniref:Uncharacterized protein n=2 Tax=Peptoniphilus indolicus TaxID=33030 RepID=G4D5M7_9FIRM|nr:hypothetical protein [Peptoniphilus indolicus]EGY78635.1 hypothetical protein HMPREF9129_1707 [Peptoniphilus indolicus ATCC 29427]SUB76097.1 Uncharacterised protein [Peptoniphilus indolicus]